MKLNDFSIQLVKYCITVAPHYKKLSVGLWYFFSIGMNNMVCRIDQSIHYECNRLSFPNRVLFIIIDSYHDFAVFFGDVNFTFLGYSKVSTKK
jgi:hypothetical protein